MAVPMVLDRPRLEGVRVSLRATAPSDADAIWEIFSDPQSMRFWSMPPWTVRESAGKLVEDDAAASRAGEAIRWGIADPHDRLIGTVSLHRFHATNRRAELGYILGSQHWGRGFAREAVGLAVDHAFGPLGLHRLEADTDPRNTASCKLLERLGFRLEGVLRERWIVDGEISDSAAYGLLAREWIAARAGSPEPTGPAGLG